MMGTNPLSIGGDNEQSTLRLLSIIIVVVILVWYLFPSIFFKISSLSGWALIILLVYVVFTIMSKSKNESRICLSCGRSVPMDGIYCPYCREPLDKSIQNNVRSKVPRPEPVLRDDKT